MKEFQPKVLSDVLLANYVLNKEDNDKFKIEKSWKESEVFDYYVIMYKIALVLLALLIIERKRPNYYQVRIIFEEAVFMDGDTKNLSFYH